MQLKKLMGRLRRRIIAAHDRLLGAALAATIPPARRRLAMAEAACAGCRIDRDTEALADKLDAEFAHPKPKQQPQVEQQRPANPAVWRRCAVTKKLIRKA